MSAASCGLLLGIDLGTSAVKVGLFAADGLCLAQARHTYPLLQPQPGWAEQNPGDWWAATCAAIRQALVQAGRPAAQIAAVGLCGQAPGHVLVDAEGAALGPALTWQDRRAVAEAAWLAERMTPAQARIWTGQEQPVDAGLPPARLRWLLLHRPADWQRISLVLQPKDYLALRLTGAAATDVHSAFALLDPATRRYHADYLDLLEIEASHLPVALDPTAVVGRVTPRAADETGLSLGTPVVTGTIDAWCAILGCGARCAGQAVDVAGTSEVVALVLDGPAQGNAFCAPLVEDLCWTGGPTQAGGGALDWLARGYYPDLPVAEALDCIEAEAAQVPAGAKGLLFLPYLAGERAPLWDERARGAFVGLSLAHTRAHCARAVYEGVALAVRHILAESAQSTGAVAAELRVAGGPAQSRFWNQVKADVCGLPVRQLEVADAGCLGAALLAALGVGIHADYRAAAQAMVRTQQTLLPNPALRGIYDDVFAVYHGLYPALRPSLHRLAAIADRTRL